MSAVPRIARDVGPVLERLIPIMDGDRLIDATVKYRVLYPSVWHRGRGLECDVDVISVTHDVGAEVRPFPMRRGLLDAIVAWIEADELED